MHPCARGGRRRSPRALLHDRSPAGRPAQHARSVCRSPPQGRFWSRTAVSTAFNGARPRTLAIWNGEGVSIERGVAGVQFRRVSANHNTDAGFDLKPFAIMSDVSAANNCRNFRFWSGGDVGTLTTGDVVKRGGTSSCSGIWLSGSQDGSRSGFISRS